MSLDNRNSFPRTKAKLVAEVLVDGSALGQLDVAINQVGQLAKGRQLRHRRGIGMYVGEVETEGELLLGPVGAVLLFFFFSPI